MGLFIKFMMLLIVLAMAAFFILNGTDIKLSDVPDAVKQISDIENPLAKNKPGGSDANRVYSWKDEQGNMHFSDTPPASGMDVKTTEYRSDTNVIPLEKAPDSEE